MCKGIKDLFSEIYRNHLHHLHHFCMIPSSLAEKFSNIWNIRKDVLSLRCERKKGNDMSDAALTNLRDYLYGTLSPANMRWLATELSEYAKKQEEQSMKLFTKEELVARIKESERQLAEGKWQDFDEAKSQGDRYGVRSSMYKETGK